MPGEGWLARRQLGPPFFTAASSGAAPARWRAGGRGSPWSGLRQSGRGPGGTRWQKTGMEVARPLRLDAGRHG
eukprot:13438058-Alexandrium_andersonii.AAC.1